MAAASDIGANFSAYQGNSNLGGSTLGSFVLDTRPLQDFARYTMLYNREEQERKQKEAEAAAAEIAKFYSLDLSTSIPKDAKELLSDNEKLTKYIRENPDALIYSTDPVKKDKWMTYNKMKSDLAQKARFAKIRDIIYKKRTEDIAKETNEGVRNVIKEKLQKNIDDTDIYTPLDVFEKNDLTVPEAGKNVGQSIEVLQRLPNEILQTKTKIFDAAEADRQGAARALGANFDNTTETGRQKDIVFKDNIYVKGADLLTKMIGEVSVGIDPTLGDTEKKEIIKQKISGVGLARDMVNSLEEYNNYVIDIQKRFKAGELSGNGINPDAYAPINWLDGVDAVEYTKLEQFLNWSGDEKETKVIQTNEQIEKQRLAVQWYNAKTGRIQEDRLAKASGASEDMALSAKKYAEALMDKLNKLKDAGGIITKDKLRLLTADELKYLGAAKTSENQFSLTPLSLQGVGSIVIDSDGTIKTFTGDPSIKGGALGEQKGQSINIATIATNKLGDEMVTTTGKEGYNFNNLIPLYQSSQQPTPEPKKTTETQTADLSQYDIPKGATVVYSKDGKVLGYELKGKKYKF